MSTNGETKDSMVGIFEKVKAEIRTGLVSSVIAEAALFPLDVVKLQQQVLGVGALEVLRLVIKERGLAGLYKGLIGRLIQTITSNVGFFMWQTMAMQAVSQHMQVEPGKKLSTGMSLVVNMLVQQFNRLLTTPVDVTANVNQSDPNAKGFISTFIHLARTGGRQALWRGLPVSMILSFNPALMFTLVDKLTAIVKAFHKSSSLSAKDMFWVSGLSKAIATLVTYPLIRAKSVQQTVGNLGLWATLVQIFEKDGRSGLYAGVWMLSYKTVLFNSLMMALKQKLTNLELQWASAPKKNIISMKEDATANLTGWQKQVVLACSGELPWTVAAKGRLVVYADGSWSYLHKAQEHLLHCAREHGDYLLVGVHSDDCHKEAIGSYPSECFAARASRLRSYGIVDAVLEGAPWKVEEDMMKELGITKVVSGYPMSKLEDCSPPAGTVSSSPSLADPYEVPKRLDSFRTVESLNKETEHKIWMERASRILFSNVDASIDWRILVRDGAKTSWGKNPGYTERERGRSSLINAKRSLSADGHMEVRDKEVAQPRSSSVQPPSQIRRTISS
jgi:glycerol-3-phosphate cytidylyltransferase-like family protein